MEKSKNLVAAIATLNELAKSTSKLTQRGALHLLKQLETAKKLTPAMKGYIEELIERNAKRVAKNEILKVKRNEKKLVVAIQTGVIQEFVEYSANIEAPSRDEAYQIMAKNVCLISYELVNTSKTTGELKGTHTVRFATRMRELYTTKKADRKPTEDELVRYYSLKDKDWRACSEYYFKGLVILPKAITNLFKRSTAEMRAYYAAVAESVIRKIRSRIDDNKVQNKLAS